MIQLKLPFDGKPDTGVYPYDVYTYVDRENKTGYEGHIRFVAASSIEEAQHIVAYDFPRYWLWCGIKPVEEEHLEKKVEVFRRQLERAENALQAVQEGKVNRP